MVILFVVAAAVAAVVWVGGDRVRHIVDDVNPLSSAPQITAVDPAAFAAGACMLYPPTSGDRHTTVFLDAGHGGLDPGATGLTEAGTTIYESDQTLPVELDALSLLRAQGFTVVVSRTSDTTAVKLDSTEASGGLLTLQGAHDDVAARDQCANEAKASLLVGIYFDSGPSASDAGSLTAYDAVRPFAAQNLSFATTLQADVLASLDAHGWAIPDDGVSNDTTLGSCTACSSGSTLGAAAANYDHLMLLGPAQAGYFTGPSSMPGALIEPLFITDPFEGTIASESVGQQAIAAGVVRAVEHYFAPPAPTTTTTNG